MKTIDTRFSQKFYKLHRSAPNMGAYLIDYIVPQYVCAMFETVERKIEFFYTWCRFRKVRREWS
jgi:hypothetical protein